MCIMRVGLGMWWGVGLGGIGGVLVSLLFMVFSWGRGGWWGMEQRGTRGTLRVRGVGCVGVADSRE